MSISDDATTNANDASEQKAYEKGLKESAYSHLFPFVLVEILTMM